MEIIEGYTTNFGNIIKTNDNEKDNMGSVFSCNWDYNLCRLQNCSGETFQNLQLRNIEGEARILYEARCAWNDE